MARHRGESSGWPDYVPFEASQLPDEACYEIISSLAERNPEASLEELVVRADRIVTSLSFLLGATESGFVDEIDAYVHAGDYGVRVLLAPGQN
jgi:hypothetical protein